MPEHYTQSTESVTKFCSTCGRITEHIVSAGRIGRCKEHSAPELSKAQQKNRQRIGELQGSGRGEGIGRNIKVQLEKAPQLEDLAECGQPHCNGCYELWDGGPKIHPPRSDY
jgi:hypothetical protein